MKTILKVFKDADFHRALKSSIAFNLLDLVVWISNTYYPGIDAGNELHIKGSRSNKTILYLPTFLSRVIVGSVAYSDLLPVL